MSGYNKLINLPEGIKKQIIDEYGSLISFYKKIFALNHESYLLAGKDNVRVSEIENEIDSIEERLEAFGLEDGSDITVEISSDHGEIIVNKVINDLNDYLADFGTDFVEMQKWLHSQYKI